MAGADLLDMRTIHGASLPDRSTPRTVRTVINQKRHPRLHRRDTPQNTADQSRHMLRRISLHHGHYLSRRRPGTHLLQRKRMRTLSGVTELRMEKMDGRGYIPCIDHGRFANNDEGCAVARTPWG